MSKSLSPFLPKRALLSVSDKRGIVDLAMLLHQQDIELVATGNTAMLLKSHGLPITDVNVCTGFPELLDGRVKTLHPAIHAGLLARGDRDADVLYQHGILPFDLLVVNLYPFEAVTQTGHCTFDDAIENIDIGGPAMIRAAAKNHQHIAVVVTPDDYSLLTKYLLNQEAPQSWPFTLAQKAFAHTAGYDTAISSYLNQYNNAEEERSDFPHYLTQQFEKQYDLRYGENPHQRGALYVEKTSSIHSLARAKLIQGKKLSYNNLLDADAAWASVRMFPENDQLCVIVKHGNPCGIAHRETQQYAYLRAYETDPASSYGGILAFNHCLQAETVAIILDKQFVEVIIAPEITTEARTLLSTKENIRVLIMGDGQRSQVSIDVRGIDGGLLVQDRDKITLTEPSYQVVTTLKPSLSQMNDLLFAWHAVKSIKSNAIVLVKDAATIGIGAGQTSRVMSNRIALWQAEEAHFEIEGAVIASDAFIPFADSVEMAAKQGVKAIIQPGGSIRDEAVIKVANELGLVMILTGSRHFKH